MILKKYILLNLMLIGLLLTACIESFNPEINKYENIMVVEGKLSNLPGPYFVKLSRSLPYDSDKSEKITGATVSIIDDVGNIELLTDSGNGTYYTHETNFQTVIGRSYKLRIMTDDNANYESEWETLKNPIPIDSIYFKYESEPKINQQGIRIYINTKDLENNTHYYAWEYEETWKFSVPFLSTLKPNVDKCFRFNNPNKQLVGTSINNQEDALIQHPIIYISDETNRLQLQYSILVRQLSISEKVYQFYKDLNNDASTGTLLQPTPSTIQGNLMNTNNPDEPVLGLFQVISITEKRIFIDKTSLPDHMEIITGFEDCRTVNVSEEESVFIAELISRGYVLMDSTEAPGLPTTYIYSNFERCFDCTCTGSLETPDYWISD